MTLRPWKRDAAITGEFCFTVTKTKYLTWTTLRDYIIYVDLHCPLFQDHHEIYRTLFSFLYENLLLYMHIIVSLWYLQEKKAIAYDVIYNRKWNNPQVKILLIYNNNGTCHCKLAIISIKNPCYLCSYTPLNWS